MPPNPPGFPPPGREESKKTDVKRKREKFPLHPPPCEEVLGPPVSKKLNRIKGHPKGPFPFSIRRTL